MERVMVIMLVHHRWQTILQSDSRIIRTPATKWKRLIPIFFHCLWLVQIPGHSILLNATTFKIAPQLCTCTQCHVEYGSYFRSLSWMSPMLTRYPSDQILCKAFLLRRTWIVATLRISFCQDQPAQLQLRQLLSIWCGLYISLPSVWHRMLQYYEHTILPGHG